jgi:hypothetical protein
MARREDILVKVVELLKAQRSVRLGKVQRDPIVIEELAATAFPAVYVESTDEEIVDITMTMGASGLERRGELEIAVVLVVGGRERDTQRNIAVEAIENTLMADRTLTNTVEDIRLSRVETVTTGESAPFASMVFTTEYCYQLNNT